MKEKLLGICEQICCKTISVEEELILSGLLDSFRIMELICSLEETFDITFLPNEIMEVENFSTVENMLAVVSNKKLCGNSEKKAAFRGDV